MITNCNSDFIKSEGFRFSKTEKEHCSIIKLSGSFKYENSKDIFEKIYKNFPVIIELDSEGNNFYFSFQLARKIIEHEIPIYVDSNNQCTNDCSLLYLASRYRYSEIPIYFPKYSKNEIQNNNSNFKVLKEFINKDSIFKILNNLLDQNQLKEVKIAEQDNNHNLSNKLNINFKSKNKSYILNQMCNEIKNLSKKQILKNNNQKKFLEI